MKLEVLRPLISTPACDKSGSPIRVRLGEDVAPTQRRGPPLVTNLVSGR